MQEKLKLDVCLSLKLVANYDLTDTIIVIIDIVRATSTICTAIEYGVDHLISVSSIEETLKLKDEGYIIAGERNGDKIEGFDMGNSPISFMDRKLEGQKIAITTTNGTATIQAVLDASSGYQGVEIIIGSFVNYSRVFGFLSRTNKNVLLVCSGWKGNPSIEDTVFAGKLAKNLEYSNRYKFVSDSVIHAILIHQLAGHNLFDFIMDNSARFREKIGNLGTDIRYCLKKDATKVLPVFSGGKIIEMKI